MMGVALFILLIWLIHDYNDLDMYPILEESDYESAQQLKEYVRVEIIITILLIVVNYNSP